MRSSGSRPDRSAGISSATARRSACICASRRAASGSRGSSTPRTCPRRKPCSACPKTESGIDRALPFRDTTCRDSLKQRRTHRWCGPMEPGFLLIPRPVPLPPRVLEEFPKPARPHYGDAWVKAHTETREMLRYLWSAPDAHVFPIAGPGHAALEAIAYTFLRPGDRVVVVSNGFFGERTHEVLMSHRLKAEVVASPWGAAPDLAKLRAALKTPTKAVAVIHNETSTGITNPLEPIVEAAHAVDAAVIVDAVSSLGGISLPFSKLGIDAAFTASQKCIAAPAGTAPT